MRTSRRFKKIYVEITNICNLSCSFCTPSLRSDRSMSPAEFSQVLDEIAPFCDEIHLHVKGEPLTHPDLSRLLDICDEKALKVCLTTNGALISTYADMLIQKKALRRINFSLQSFEDSENTAGLTRYLQDIAEFSKMAVQETGMQICYRFWNLDRNNEVNVDKKVNRPALGILETLFDLKEPIAETITKGKEQKLGERIHINFEAAFIWPDMQAKPLWPKGFCPALKASCAILADGTVVPCCLDGEGQIALGNVFVSSFDRIVAGERAGGLMEGFRGGVAVEDLCRRCEKWGGLTAGAESISRLSSS